MSCSDRRLGAVIVTAAVVLLSACGSAAGTTASQTDTTSTTATTSTAPGYAAKVETKVLLDKASQTILGQPFTYPTAQPPQITASELTLPPGAETGLHKHDAPLVAYVLDGELTVEYDGGVTKTFKKGDALVEAIETPHNGRNVSGAPVKLFVVNVGAQGVNNTVKL